jgi:hypothetical protein
MTDTEMPPNIVVAGAQEQVFSPSPVPGQPAPQRRAEDTDSQMGHWTVLSLALLGWAASFCLDMASFESFKEVLTPKFLGVHISQLFSVTLAVVTAKRMR